MTTDRAVIHKIVATLDLDPQTVTVPRGAKLLHVDRDTRDLGIAVWYRLTQSRDGYTGPEYTTDWHLQVVGTGQPFPADAEHLGTVVWPGFAWHLFDLDRGVQR